MSNHSTQRAGEVQLRTLLIPLSLFRFLFFLPFFDERHTFRCSAEAAICHSAACLSLDRSCTPSPNPDATQSPWGSLSVPLLTTHCLSTCPGGMEPPPRSSLQGSFSVSPPEHTRPKPSVAISVCKAPGSPGLGGGKEIWGEIFYSCTPRQGISRYTSKRCRGCFGLALQVATRQGQARRQVLTLPVPSPARLPVTVHTLPLATSAWSVCARPAAVTRGGGRLKGHQKAGAGPGCSPTACTYCSRFDFCLLFAWRHGVTQTHAAAGWGHGGPPHRPLPPSALCPPWGARLLARAGN